MNIYKDCRNPVLPPYVHIPDPEAHVMPDGRVYVYGSWDQDDVYYCSRQYRVFSSDNMVDWVDHDVSFDSSRVPWANDPYAPRYVDEAWANPTPFLKRMLAQRSDEEQTSASAWPTDLLFAPDAAYRNDQCYLYFCMADGSEGVATAGRPMGAFTDPIRLPCGGIDPAVFVDDDGQVYYYWGQFRANAARLASNMIEFGPEPIIRGLVTEEEHGFHEGSSVRKRGDTYYFVYSCIARGRPTSLAYATGPSPLGPFTYRGIIIDNTGCDPETWNNHGSIEEVNGQWYVFYHRSSRNSRLYRRLCIEPIAFDDDGAIAEVPMTSQGAGRPFEAGETIEAYRACGLRGGLYVAPTRGTQEGLMGIANGDEALFRYVDWPEPAAGLSVEALGSGEIAFYIDDGDEPRGQALVERGHTNACWFGGPAGRHAIRLAFSGVDGLQLQSFTLG